MTKVVIYHNPRCSKSRETLALLRERGVDPTVIDYLREPPSVAQLKRIVRLLGASVRDLLRRNETEYEELNLDDPSLSDTALLRALHAHPRLLQRPIVIVATGAVIGRPPGSVLAILPN